MNVSEIMPPVLNHICRIALRIRVTTQQSYAIIIDMISVFGVDKNNMRGVFILTCLNAPSREEDQNFASRPQTRCLAPFWHPPSPPETGHRSSVCSTRLLRSPRHAPGQIRNASQSTGRWAIDQPHLHGFWVLPSHLLPGPSRLQSRRSGRPTAAEARTTSAAQALGGDPSLCRSTPSQRRPSVYAHSHPAYSPAIRLGRPSAQSGTGSGPAQKKTPVVHPQCHYRSWLRSMSCWPTMRPYVARSWELRLRELPAQDGFCWSGRAWLAGCKGPRYQSQRPYPVRVPVRWWCSPACNPKWPTS